MKKIHLVINEEKDRERRLVTQIRDYLLARGVSCTEESINRDDTACGLSEDLHDTDCVLTLGGDGTFIQVASKTAGSNIPMLGVNLGKTGYLTEVEQENVLPALERILAGQYLIENRMMLTGTYTDETGAAKERFALNDIVISRYGSFRAVRYELYVNNCLLNSYDADGMIISTPTGSTGYNLSAGGPIVKPTARLILVNPVCPHTLNTRAIVLSSEDVIRVRVIGGRFGQEFEAGVSCDGGRTDRLRAAQEVTVCRAEVETRLIRLKEESFLDTLSRKMKG